jgi:ABC-type transporter Mla subunit MlaD
MSQEMTPATVADLKAMAEKLAEVTNQFKAKSDELAKKAETAMAEVKDKGQLLTETKAQVDKILS